MDIQVKKCDRCGKIYNLESSRKLNDRGDHYSNVLTYEENGHNAAEEVYAIFDPNGIRLDLCYSCYCNLLSFVNKKEDV